MKTMHMICPVGQRAAAVVMPIQALFEHDRDLAQTPCRFTLLHTGLDDGRIKKTRDACAAWIERHIPGASIAEPRLFPASATDVRSLWAGDEALYLNANGGMNWQIASLALHLPLETTCIASDSQRLYRWGLADDIARGADFPLPDLGLEGYLLLDDQIMVQQAPGPSKTLSAPVREALRLAGAERGWRVTLKGESASAWGYLLQEHVVYVRERRGRLYLVLDLCSGHPRIGSDPKTALQRYRIVGALVSEIRYGSVIVSDIPSMRTRALADGVEAMAPEDLGAWLAGRPRKPKRLLPVGLGPEGNAAQGPFAKLLALTARRPASPQPAGQPPAEELHVCLGDNTAPTLRLAMTGRYNPIRLWYDDQSPQIRYLAGQFKDVVRQVRPDIEVTLHKTDHRGAGIVEAYAAGLAGQANVTPGTKLQAVALAAAARRAGAAGRVASIGSDRVVRLAAPGAPADAAPLDQLPLETLLRVQIPPFAERHDQWASPELWRWVMAKLADTGLVMGGTPSLLDMRVKSTGQGSIKAFSRHEGAGPRITRNLDGAVFPVEDQALREGGFWWEYAVAQALHEHLCTPVFTQVTWDWCDQHRPGTFMSELDIVFTLHGETWAVSCKTSKDPLNVLPVKSEAERRLGRMTHSCLAVPHNDMRDAGRALNGVLILTPAVLDNGRRLEEAMQAFREAKRTMK